MSKFENEEICASVLFLTPGSNSKQWNNEHGLRLDGNHAGSYGKRIKNGINMSYFNDITEASSMERLYLEKLKNWKTSKTNLNFSVIGHNFNCNSKYSNFISILINFL